MKIVKKILAFIVIVLVCLVIFRNGIAGLVLKTAVKITTKARVEYEQLKIGWLFSNIHIKNLKLLNPPEFKDKRLLTLKELYLNYRILPLLSQKLHIKKAVLNLQEFALVKNSQGVSNIQAIMSKFKREKENNKPKDTEQSWDIQIDFMDLKIGHLVFNEETETGNNEKIIPINFSRTYSDINNLSTWAALFTSQMLTSTTLEQFKQLRLDNIFQGITNTTVNTFKKAGGFVKDAAQNTVQGVGNTTANTVKKAGEFVGDAAQQTVQGVGNVLNKTTDAIKNILPFNK